MLALTDSHEFVVFCNFTFLFRRVSLNRIRSEKIKLDNTRSDALEYIRLDYVS